MTPGVRHTWPAAVERAGSTAEGRRAGGGSPPPGSQHTEGDDMAKRTTSRNNPTTRQAAPIPPAAPPEAARGGVTAPTGTRPESLEDEIRLRAYYRYLEREPEECDAMADWLEAESDVLGRRATGVEAAERSREEESGTS
jgi:DUF2934 family protein